MMDLKKGTPVRKHKTGFLVVFHRKGQDTHQGKSGELEDTVEKTREKTREKILRMVKERPEITIKELAEEIGLSSKGVEWNLRKLKAEGRLRRVGPAKGGHWAVITGNEGGDPE